MFTKQKPQTIQPHSNTLRMSTTTSGLLIRATPIPPDTEKDFGQPVNKAFSVKVVRSIQYNTNEPMLTSIPTTSSTTCKAANIDSQQTMISTNQQCKIPFNALTPLLVPS
jgi:hypothetical protein